MPPSDSSSPPSDSGTPSSVSSPAPSDSVPAPSDSSTLPSVSGPAPSDSSLPESVSGPAQADSVTPLSVSSTPSSVSVPAPSVSVPAPSGSSPAPSGSSPAPRGPDWKRFLWQGRIGPAFWTTTGAISLAVNIILVVILLLVARQLFDIKQLISSQLVGGLAANFAQMDQATIKTVIPVDDNIQVKFDLPVKTNTNVILTQDTVLNNALVSVYTGGLVISNAQANIVLKAGTVLPIALDISVPVETTVPVHLNVAVNIPLNQTELHQPFVGLQNVVSPYQSLLNSLPNSWSQVFCIKDSQGKCK
jgi:hypothetical protein